MPFGSLWLPVVVSAVAVWIASSVLHMALRYHKVDYRPMPNEDAVREAMRKANPGPGLYVMPYCADPSQMKQPEIAKKYAEGPVALVAIMENGAPKMGKHLALWFGFCLLASFVSAYIARHTLNYGADGMTVLRVTGAVAFCCYGIGELVGPIWRATPWSNTLRSMFDAAVYSVLTAAIFTLLWPSA